MIDSIFNIIGPAQLAFPEPVEAALIAFVRHHLGADGQTFVIFVLCVAAAEAAMALALVVLLFRHRESLGASAWKELNG